MLDFEHSGGTAIQGLRVHKSLDARANPTLEEDGCTAGMSSWTAKGFEMVTRHEGSYSLKAGSDSLQGSYMFLVGNGTLREVGTGTLNHIGTLSCHRMEDVPAPETSAPSEPCIEIMDSEIMVEIQKPENHGAFFVLPSQLNSAEYPSDRDVVCRVEEYKFDNTGGPRGQLAAHPAVAQFLLDNAACDSSPQGVNAVREVLVESKKAGFDLQLVNGYLKVPHTAPSQQPLALQAFRSSIRLLRLLAMEDVPACGLLPSKKSFSGATHKVNLVYASAMPVDAYLNETDDPDQVAFQAQVAEVLLIAQYYSALKKAAARGPGTKIFLMPLGGGVFNNSWDTIAHSMSAAVDKLSDEERCHLQICALTWSGNFSERTTLTELLRSHGKLLEAKHHAEVKHNAQEKTLKHHAEEKALPGKSVHRVHTDGRGRRLSEIRNQHLSVKGLAVFVVFLFLEILDYMLSTQVDSSRMRSSRGPLCALIVLAAINLWTFMNVDLNLLEWR